LKIEEYFLLIQRAVESSPIVRLSDMTYEKRGTYEGVVRGRLQFVDDTVLELREYVDVETKKDRLMYVYQYMDSSNNLVFRYDNTGHHKRLGLLTYPHHKHEGREVNVVPADAKDLPAVLDEVELIAKLP
jgi:CRISPR/Cas system-associated exonuclease Cas4 (RecB family)